MKPIEVLIVDDSPADVFLIRQALALQSPPMSVHVAKDGAEALQLLAASNIHPDLMILDLEMPRVPGLAFLELYRAAFPVVVFSSSDNLDDQRRALELGAREFFRKPPHFEAFSTMVSQIVRTWANAA